MNIFESRQASNDDKAAFFVKTLADEASSRLCAIMTHKREEALSATMYHDDTGSDTT